MSDLNPEERNFIHSYFDLSVDKGPESLYEDLISIEGRYIEAKIIASGGMKEIYSCLDTATDREVAKAVLINQKNPQAIEDFLREARITASLQHPNIIPVYDIAKDENGCPFFTMKKVEGETLTEYRRKVMRSFEGVESWSKVLNLFLKISEAVAYAHSKGVLHLDLKPDNIQVSQYGEVLVCDWGLAKIKAETISDERMANYMLHETLGQNLTRHGLIQGSPGYMAPEQADPNFGGKDELTDIFALGCLMYFLITGKAAIEETNLKSYMNLLKRSDFRIPSQITQVPEGIEAICLKAMSLNKIDRYQNVKSVISDVQTYLLGFAPKAEKAGFLKQCRLFYLRNQKSCRITFIFLALLFLIAVMYTSDIDRSRRETEQALVEVKKINDEKTELISWYKNGIMSTAVDSFKKGLYSNTLNILHDLHFPEANKLKIEVFLIMQKMEEAKLIATEYSNRGIDELIKVLSDTVVEGRFDLPKIMQIKRSNWMSDKFKRLIIEYHLENFSTLEEKLNLIPELLKEANGIENLKFKYEIKPEGLIIDLSHNSKLRRMNWINHFGNVVELNLSNTSMLTLKSINELPLKKLNLENTLVDNINLLEMMSLSELNIAQTKIKNLSSLSKMSSLEKLILSRKIYEQENKSIPAHIKLNIKD